MSGHYLRKTFLAFVLHRSIPCAWNLIACHWATCFLQCSILLSLIWHKKRKNDMNLFNERLRSIYLMIILKKVSSYMKWTYLRVELDSLNTKTSVWILKMKEWVARSSNHLTKLSGTINENVWKRSIWDHWPSVHRSNHLNHPLLSCLKR